MLQFLFWLNLIKLRCKYILIHTISLTLGSSLFLQGSLACSAPRGHLVWFGLASGEPDPVQFRDLAPKSLSITAASVFNYTSTREELLESAGEVFSNVASGVLRIRVNHTYPLSEAARAHADLEARKTSGSIVLIPDN